MPDIRLATNSVPPTNVRETDDAYVIEDVPFHKPKENLDGGYTPRANVEQTAAGWDGVPTTLFHVRNAEGKPIAAHNAPDKHIGSVVDPSFDGEHVRANFRIEKAELDDLGDEADAIREALEGEESIEVSSQYAANDLPPGEYDGEFRTDAAAIVRPDSVAILPEGTGRCSIEDGCGINPQMAANATLTVPMTDDPLDGEDLGAAGADADVDADDLPDDVQPGSLTEIVANAVARVLPGSDAQRERGEGPQSPADADGSNNMDDTDKIEFIVANSDFDRENVAKWEGEQCLTSLYEQVKANADGDGDGAADGADDPDDQPDDDPSDGDVVELTEEELDDRIEAAVEERAEEIVANREDRQQKADLADTIVANSAEYDDAEAVIDDYPTVPALESKREQVTGSGGVPGRGISANAASGGADDDLSEGVSPGVFE